MSLFKELKRRNVFKVAAAYIIVGWLIMQAGATLAPALHLPEWVNSVLIFFLLLGFPLALFFAWAFEITPEGLKREHEVDRTQSMTPQTGKKLNLLITVVLLLALGYFAVDKFVLSTERDAALVEATKQAVTERAAAASQAVDADKSIAVLPFVNMSDDQGNEYFSDGLSEELLNLLARIPQLRVIARTSSFAFKGEKIEIAEIAKKLNVAHVLEGSVRKSGNQLRITVQLIRASDSSHLWSQSYDRSLDDVFAIQDEISAAVVEQLKITLLGAAPLAEKVNPEAYSLILQARYFASKGGEDNLAEATLAYRQALDIAPGYAAAWAGLADVTGSQAAFAYIELATGVEQARVAAERAIALNPGLAAGWTSLAGIQRGFDWNWKDAEESMQKALQLEHANSAVLVQAGILAQKLGKYEQAEADFENALAVDPLNLDAIYLLSLFYEYFDRLDEAENTLRRVIKLNPDGVKYHSDLGYILLRQGKADQALIENEKELEDEWRSFGKARILYTLGKRTEADAELAAFIEKEHEAGAYQVAEIHAWRNEPDEAFQWLETAFQNRDPGMAYLIPDTSLRNLHNDPRWEPLLAKMGLLDAWKAMLPRAGKY